MRGWKWWLAPVRHEPPYRAVAKRGGGHETDCRYTEEREGGRRAGAPDERSRNVEASGRGSVVKALRPAQLTDGAIPA